MQGDVSDGILEFTHTEFSTFVRMGGSASLDKTQPRRVKMSWANVINRPYSLSISHLRERSNNYDVSWFESVMKKMNNDQIGQL